MMEYKNEKGQYHREDGPAVEYTDGSKFWYQNGMLHREDGPAIERANGTKKWYKNDIRHRTDGPAIEWVNGTKEWWVNGKEYTKQEFNEKYKINKYLTVFEYSYLALLRLPIIQRCDLQYELCNLRNIISDITGDDIEKVQNKYENIALEQKEFMKVLK